MADDYLIPKLTNDGLGMLICAMDGGMIKFTRFVFGDGAPDSAETVTELTNPRLEIGITEYEKKDGYLVLTGGCNNTMIEESFYAKELGVYAKSGDDEDAEEKLYAYRYAESEVDFFPATGSGRVLEIVFSIIVQIGDAENVSAVLVNSDAYASKKDFQDHLAEDNPHGITPTGIGASEEKHTHSTDDMKSGTLPIERGGTGTNSINKLATKIQDTGILGIPVFGIYTGDGTSGRTISLGFTPKAVILVDAFGNMHDDVNGYVGGIAVGNAGCCSQKGSLTDATTWNASYTTLMIVTGGFKVNYNSSYKVYSNMSGRTYRYIAFQ